MDKAAVELELQMRRVRNQIIRRRASVRKAEAKMRADIKEALALGASPTMLAKAAGVHVSRIYQIKNEEN